MMCKIYKVISLFTIIVFAAGVPGLKAEESNKHKVVKGDTLWDISEHYLKDPLLWPKIWKLNPDIGNPHLISPGQIVKIPALEERPGTETPFEGKGLAIEKPTALAPAVTAAPAVSAPPAKKVAVDISKKQPLPIQITTKTEGPEIVEQETPMDAAVAKAYDRGIGIVTDEIPKMGRVLHTEEGWKSTGVGGTIFINAPDAKIGQLFGVYRDRGEVDHPSRWTGSPGHLLSDIGIIEVIASDSTKQLARVKRAFIEVEMGDVLGPVPEKPVVTPKEKGRMLKMDGTIVALENFRDIAGIDDIVYIDLGKEDGLAPGDKLFVKNKEKEDTREAGEIMILRVTPKTAAALVTRESKHELIPGDKVDRLL